MTKIAQIVMMTEQGYISKICGLLPIICPSDMEKFKDITRDKSVIMGRKTFKEIGKPLARRLNIVLTKNPNFYAPGIMIADSIDEALKFASMFQNFGDEIVIIGGGDVYRQTIKLAHKLYINVIRNGKTEIDNIDKNIRYPLTYEDIVAGNTDFNYTKIIEAGKQPGETFPMTNVTLEKLNRKTSIEDILSIKPAQ